ncbi:hypothetical protein ACFE04_026947 [Oxalis oulophora]
MENNENKSIITKRDISSELINKVGEVISTIKTANHVDQLICALHSLSVLLFPLDSSLIAGSVDERYKDQILKLEAPSAADRANWRRAFYKGAAFPILARVLLLEVASNWLACFPLSVQKHVYDVFFIGGIVTEVVQVLVPYLERSKCGDFDVNVVQSNIGRLLVLSLLENDGVLRMAREFGDSCQSEDYTVDQLRLAATKAAQVVASIPDKAQWHDQRSLLAQYPYFLASFFEQITIQLISGAEEEDIDSNSVSLLFVGEMFSRICRRGSSDVLLSKVTPNLLSHARNVLSSNSDSDVVKVFKSTSGSQFWFDIIEAIRDPYVVERISEQLLHQLATEHASDEEAYWVLWILFHRAFKNQATVRSIFVDKFLLWKVFPVSCLRWILQFSVFKHPPVCDVATEYGDSSSFLDIVQNLAAVWSKREFVQSAPMEQQAYVTAAVGLCLENMSKEDLDKTKDTMQSILQGVSCRLESPTHLVRKMASCIALAFSKVIDPKNPLYLDDIIADETIDWEFGLSNPKTKSKSKLINEAQISSIAASENDMSLSTNNGLASKVKAKSKKPFEFKLVDPDEIIDPATLNDELVSDNDEDDNASESSESSNDSSLQPYDLSDDDTDLKRKFSQLVDVVAALRKTDDVDGVERALDVAEKLIRASPDELKHIAGDLARTLVNVRCSDVSLEGEEESTEEKRQRALIALLVMCPFESLDTLNNLLYSPNVDTSQRIMILDVMTSAAQELANSKIMKPKQQRALISNFSEPQPWFLPSEGGPPGAGSWKEISGTVKGTLLSWTDSYERDLPLRPSHAKRGKTRRWSLRSENIKDRQIEWSHNKFPLYAAAFMLPAMQGFDKKRHGVDLLGRDFIVLGKLIYTLGVCIKCASMHPEASALAPHLLDMLRSREVYQHKEAYVRRAVLFAASCVLMALNPSYVASSMIEGNIEVSNGLDWIRMWALQVADSDSDRECYVMAVTCLKLHSEMALQASRALESTESNVKSKNVALPTFPSEGTIKIPYGNTNVKLF